MCTGHRLSIYAAPWQGTAQIFQQSGFPVLLFTGLGNPGPEYSGNRHNIGFMAVDRIARVHNFPPFRARFHGKASEGMIDGEKVLLFKPETFMNESGRAVADAVRFHKLAPADVLVLHDELDLGAGKFRVKLGGGNAGHNGLRSITAHIGNDYRRARIGIGHPGDKAQVYGYVLSDFAKNERAWVDVMCETLARNAELLVRLDDSGIQNKVDLAMKGLE